MKKNSLKILSNELIITVIMFLDFQELTHFRLTSTAMQELNLTRILPNIQVTHAEGKDFSLFFTISIFRDRLKTRMEREIGLSASIRSSLKKQGIINEQTIQKYIKSEMQRLQKRHPIMESESKFCLVM